MKRLKTTKIKIVALEIGHLSETAVSGGDILLEKMAPFLKNKVELSVIIPKIGAHHWRKHQNNVSIYILTRIRFKLKLNRFLILFSYLLRSYQAYVKLRKLNFDIIYSSTNILPDILPVYLFRLRHPRKPWIARVHHLIPSPTGRVGNFLVNFAAFLIQNFTIKLIKKADLILVLNAKLKRDLGKEGLVSRKIKILEGGVNFSAISKFKPTQAQNFDAVSLGRIHYTKGVFDLPLIWEKVVKVLPNAKLAVIGTGPAELTSNLRSQIELLSLEKKITLTGFLPQRKVWSILKNSKVFLFTDHEAGFGLAVAEAMAAGLPVIGWNIGILGQVFKKGYIMVPLEEIHKFAKAVVSLLDNDINYKKLSQEAKIEASRHDWTKTSLKFNQILNKIIR